MKRVKLLVAKVLDIDVDSITPETSPETVPTWDSFNALMLVSELEREFGVSFSIEDITEVKNVAGIKLALEKYGVTLYED